MKVAACFLLLLLLTGCIPYDYEGHRGVRILGLIRYEDDLIVFAMHDIPAQTVIQGADLNVGDGATFYKYHGRIPAHTIPFKRDFRNVVGHKALHAISQGEPLDRSDFD